MTVQIDEGTVLLVEDNPRDEELTLLALEESHLVNEIVVARDGAEALDYLFGTGVHAGRDTRVQPQLVLLDLKLPKVDGLEVLARLRQDARTALLPVVMLTSSDVEHDLVRSYQLHVNSYIRKPVDFVQFLEAIKHLGMYWLLLNHAPSQQKA
jgi:CheY-like chemotaxis protein